MAPLNMITLYHFGWLFRFIKNTSTNSSKNVAIKNPSHRKAMAYSPTATRINSTCSCILLPPKNGFSSGLLERINFPTEEIAMIAQRAYGKSLDPGSLPPTLPNNGLMFRVSSAIKMLNAKITTLKIRSIITNFFFIAGNTTFCKIA